MICFYSIYCFTIFAGYCRPFYLFTIVLNKYIIIKKTFFLIWSQFLKFLKFLKYIWKKKLFYCWIFSKPHSILYRKDRRSRMGKGRGKKITNFILLRKKIKFCEFVFLKNFYFKIYLKKYLKYIIIC